MATKVPTMTICGRNSARRSRRPWKSGRRPSMTRKSPSSTTFESTRAGHDDLRSIGLLTEDRDLRACLAALHATARDDPPRGEGLVWPQHVGELHVQPAAQVEATAEMPGQ